MLSKNARFQIQKYLNGSRMVAESSLKNICKKVTEIIISMIYVFKAEGDFEAMRRCDKDSG